MNGGEPQADWARLWCGAGTFSGKRARIPAFIRLAIGMANDTRVKDGRGCESDRDSLKLDDVVARNCCGVQQNSCDR